MRQRESHFGLAGWFLRRLIPSPLVEGYWGDIHEEYERLRMSRSPLMAEFWLWSIAMRSVPAALSHRMKAAAMMVRHTATAAWRNGQRHRFYAILNILGLSIGIAGCLLVFLYVRDEVSYDKIPDQERIYRIVSHQPGHVFMGKEWYATTPAPLAGQLSTLPGVEAATSFRFMENTVLQSGSEPISVSGIYADENFFQVLKLGNVRGGNDALGSPNAVVLTRELADRLDAELEILGDEIKINGMPMTVTGILDRFPGGSSFGFECLVSLAGTESTDESKRLLEDWNRSSSFTYIKLNESTGPESLEGPLENLILTHVAQDSPNRFVPQPLKRIHLHSHINMEHSRNGSGQTVLLFSGIGAILLLLACINTMNLATARSMVRAREIGLRKTIGASRSEIRSQFMGEALAYSFLGVVFGLWLTNCGLPVLNALSDKTLSFRNVLDAGFFAVLFAVWLCTGILSGLYPACVLSNILPASIFRSQGSFKNRSSFQNALIVFQFAVSILLMGAMLGIRSQLGYIRNKDTGMNREQVMVLRIPNSEGRNPETLKQAFRSLPGVTGAAFANALPARIQSQTTARLEKTEGEMESYPVFRVMVDPDFLDVMGIRLLSGRNFSRDFPADGSSSVLVNETLVAEMGWEDGVGKQVQKWPLKDGHIIGVVHDFHFNSFHHKIAPLMIFFDSEVHSNLLLRIETRNLPGLIAELKRVYGSFHMATPFSFSFLNEETDRMYRSEQRLGQMLGLFSSLALFVGCIGLIGLSAFAASRRRREIGIRKVLGAGSGSILRLLSMSFLRWNLAANLIAWPLLYLFLERWLRQFAYAVSVSVWSFVLSAGLALVLAWFSVLAQTLRTVRTDPAKVLRME